MLLENDLNSLLSGLAQNKNAEVFLHGSVLTLELIDQASSKLLLSTPVYNGGNYIPKSVREGLKKHPDFSRHAMHTNFVVDEENFIVTLAHNNSLLETTKARLVDILEEFSILADEWRLYLDEQDKNDLIHVRTV